MDAGNDKNVNNEKNVSQGNEITNDATIVNNYYTSFPPYAGYSGLGRGIPFGFNGVRYGQPTNHSCYDYTTASAIANGIWVLTY